MTIKNGKVSYAHFLYAAAHDVPVQDVLDDDVSALEALMQPIEDFVRAHQPTSEDMYNIGTGEFMRKMREIAKLPIEFKMHVFDWFGDPDGELPA